MDMSLDEIIRNKTFASRGGRRGGVQDSSRDGSNRRGGANGSPNFWSNGSIGPIRKDRSMARSTNGFNPYTKGVVTTSWTHNMYEEHKRQKMGDSRSITNSHKIIISNLDFGVTSKDIQELFNEFGLLKTATVHYNRSGRSLGTADVVFSSKNAALNAVRQYNNVPLDGRPMKIEYATDLSTIANLATRLSRPVSIPIRGIRGSGFGGSGIQGIRGNIRRLRSNNRDSPRGKGGRRGRDTVKKMPNKDELDAELDRFIESKNN